MKKIIVCVLSFIMICSCFISCSKTEGNDGAVNYEVQLEAPPEQTGKLVIYQAPEMEDILQLAVPIFKAKFPEVEVELKEFGSYAEDLKNGSQNSENYRTQLQSELMAGQGPDILLWNNRPESGLYGSGFADVNKVLESGVFYNLDNFIVHDDTFDINDYNENVLNGGMYKGERLFIPITYGVTAFTTSKENLDRNQIKLSEDLNFNQFSKIISDYCKNNEDNINNWLFDTPGYDNSLGSIFFPYNGLELIDYVQGTVKVHDDNSFKITMETYKNIYSMLNRYERGIDYTLPHSFQAIRNGNLLLDMTTLGFSMWDFTMSYDCLLALEQTPVFFCIPNVNGGKTPAYTGTCAAIRKTSENKANAYEFIKILLSSTMQEVDSGTVMNMDIPVLKKSIKEKLKVMMQANKYYADEGVASKPATDEQIEDIYQKILDVECIKNYGSELSDILWKNMKPYFDGTESYDKCVKNLENELKLYVAE